MAGGSVKTLGRGEDDHLALITEGCNTSYESEQDGHIVRAIESSSVIGRHTGSIARMQPAR